MQDKISLLSAFGAAQSVDRLVKKFNTPEMIESNPALENEHILRTSMRHVFKIMEQINPRSEFPDTLTRNKVVSGITESMLASRLSLAAHHMPDFFPKNYPTDYNGMTVAIIAENFASSIKDIPPSIAGNGFKYWQEGHQLSQEGLGDDLTLPPSLEGAFLAHLNGLNILKEIEDVGLHDMDEAALLKILEEKLPPMRTYIHYGKTVGMALQDLLETAETEIRLALEDVRQLLQPPISQRPIRDRSHLRLVHSRPSLENL